MYRFAPSPTGDMHIGNLRAALINYVLAKKNNEKFVLRIEDTDTARNIKGKDKDIKELLELFGIKWDLFFLQSDNFKFHQRFALDLVQKGKAFACFCTSEELDAKKDTAKKQKIAYRYDGTCEKLSDVDVLNNEKPFVIRLKKPQNAVAFHDEIKGDLSFEPNDIDSFVILRTDKTPTYNFACAVDDMLEDISVIIRGEDHVSNTPKQEHIRHSLGYDKKLTYAHLPIILNEEGKKMSKREAHSSVKHLLEIGILPNAIANYLLLLGNNTPCEVFTLDEAIDFFDIKKLSKSPAKFDMAKLLWINKEHIKRLDGEILYEKIVKNEDLAKIFDNKNNFFALCQLYLQEANTLEQLREKIINLTQKIPNDLFLEYENEIKTIEICAKNLFDDGFCGNFDEFKSVLMQKTNLKGKKFFMPLRLVLTSSAHGPELVDLYPCLQPFLNKLIKAKLTEL